MRTESDTLPDGERERWSNRERRNSGSVWSKRERFDRVSSSAMAEEGGEERARETIRTFSGSCSDGCGKEKVRSREKRVK